MNYWIQKKGKKVFAGGKNSFTEAVYLAENCSSFAEDCEDELVCDDPVSCYNCRYRRWTQDSFECIKRLKENE